MVSGGAVIASMAGLFIVGGATFDSLASGAIVVVAVAVVGSVTVLPALLAKLGRWADRPRLPLLWRLNRRIGHGGLSRRILAPVVRRPVAALVLSLTALVALAAPALSMRTHDANLDTLPHSIAEVQTLRAVAEQFPSQGTTATVVVRGAAGEHDHVVGRPHLAGVERGDHAVVRPSRTRGDRDLTRRPDRAADAAHPVLVVRRAVGPGGPAAPRPPGPRRPGRPAGRARGRRRRRHVARLRLPPVEPAAAG